MNSAVTIICQNQLPSWSIVYFPKANKNPLFSTGEYPISQFQFCKTHWPYQSSRLVTDGIASAPPPRCQSKKGVSRVYFRKCLLLKKCLFSKPTLLKRLLEDQGLYIIYIKQYHIKLYIYIFKIHTWQIANWKSLEPRSCSQERQRHREAARSRAMGGKGWEKCLTLGEKTTA